MFPFTCGPSSFWIANSHCQGVANQRETWRSSPAFAFEKFRPLNSGNISPREIRKQEVQCVSTSCEEKEFPGLKESRPQIGPLVQISRNLFLTKQG